MVAMAVLSVIHIMQVANDLVEGGREGVVDVAKDAVCLLELEPLAQIPDDGMKCLGGGNFGDASGERRGVSDSLELDDDLLRQVLASTGQGGGHIAWLGCQDS
ncbi:hypothetical protein ColTof4_03311 [Colletotrichum tofieldiae]|nr:hypothetical protein ColTof3_13272 [Colletotrichum tofieldiae]GKT70888.1 hypothetical protein ColTof4_03311 [Colletotrichum tofieldiae]GKT94212.1 hypothetical protein Ct61P_12062 [Colletotrichum tofieldiae]